MARARRRRCPLVPFVPFVPSVSRARARRTPGWLLPSLLALLAASLLAGACSAPGAGPGSGSGPVELGPAGPPGDRAQDRTAAEPPGRSGGGPGGSDPGDPTGLHELTGLAAGDLAAVVRSAPDRLATARTGRVRTRLDTAAGEGAGDLGVAAVIDCAWDLTVATRSCTAWVLNGGDLVDALTVVEQPGARHVRRPEDPDDASATAPGELRSSPAPWVPTPPAPVGGSPAPFPPDRSQPGVVGPALLLRGAHGTAEVTGEDTVGGVATVEVATTVDLLRAVHTAPPEVAAALEGDLGGLLRPGERPARVWLDGAGIPRRVQIELADPTDGGPVAADAMGWLHAGRTTTTMEVADLDAPVTIEVPEAGDGAGG